MKNVIEFIKQRYKIFIPIMVVLVLLITVYYLYREYKYDNYRNKQEYDVYQYFGGVRKDYKAIITYNLKDIIIGIEDKEKEIQYDSTPVYFASEEKILFPNEMSIVFPLQDGNQYKLYKYSIYENKDEAYQIVSGRESGEYNNFFLFDNKDLFFFADPVTIKINGEDYVNLGANSYARVVGGYTLIYYDKENDKSEMIEIDGKKVTASNKYLDLSLSDRYYYIYGKKTLLIPSYNLNGLLSD